jgi:hypothetical protein
VSAELNGEYCPSLPNPLSFLIAQLKNVWRDWQNGPEAHCYKCHAKTENIVRPSANLSPFLFALLK